MSTKKNKNNSSNTWIIVVVIVVLIALFSRLTNSGNNYNSDYYTYSTRVFSIISSSENKVLDEEIKKFAKKEGISIHIDYDDTLSIIKRLNKGEKYDSVWLSNSIWMYSLDSSKTRVSDTKSTSINPIVFGIKKSKAKELGFVDKTIYTKDIVDAVQSGKLKFSMSNPVTTNSGASAYLGILTTLAGNPEVLTQDMLNDAALKEKLKTFFSGLERSSGNEDYLEELFVNGDYDAVFTYESSIININKTLEKNKKDVLYAVYPVDGVSISDSPIGFIDQGDDQKKEDYDKLVEFLIGKDGQDILANIGRRTWYGGTNDNVNTKIFNPEWGIDTKKYISPLKYPSTSVIQEALKLYQESIRKPVHVVFCLDYSGSMYGDGIEQLRDAMDFILTDRAEAELLQFTDEDIIDVIPFSSSYDEVWHSEDVSSNLNLLNKINDKSPSGGTALFPATEKALDLLKSEDKSKYNTSVIVMTDGAANIGVFKDLEKYYNNNNFTIPIYSIKFASASENQLKQLSQLSNGKVFDGSDDLVDAFKEVRGYN